MLEMLTWRSANGVQVIAPDVEAVAVLHSHMVLAIASPGGKVKGLLCTIKLILAI